MKPIFVMSAALLCGMLGARGQAPQAPAQTLKLPASTGLDKDTVYKIIRANYAMGAIAIAHKQAAPIIALQAPTFRYKRRNGMILTRQQDNAGIRSMIAHFQSIKITYAFQKLTLKNNQVVVLLRVTQKMMMQDKQGKLHNIDLVATTRDTWIKTVKGWKINYTEELSVASGKEV